MKDTSIEIQTYFKLYLNRDFLVSISKSINRKLKILTKYVPFLWKSEFLLIHIIVFYKFF